MISMQYRRQDLPLSPSDVFFCSKILLRTSLLWGSGTCKERVVARRVWPDQRWDAGVCAGDGHPGSHANKGRLLAVDYAMC
jgi:hypothetical protein